MKTTIFKHVFSAGFFALTMQVQAQNLVINPDMQGTTPSGFGQISSVNGWSSASKGTVDLYSSAAGGDFGIPSNRQGNLKAANGKNYAGIIPYWKGSYSEYLQAKLSTPLVAGKMYNIRFKAIPSDKSVLAVKGLGAVLSFDPLAESNSGYISRYVPVRSEEYITDKSAWTTVSGIIVADGGEQYITIGLFSNAIDDVAEPIKISGNAFPNEERAYYYIDDVSVTTSDGSLINAGKTDSDGDGVEDSQDECPEIAGKKELAGCPDSDNDGVSDDKDVCPTVAGIAANKGCPEIKDEIKKILALAMQGVQFESGKDIIKTSSYDELDNIAKVMNDHPHFKLGINGHTDSQGNAEANQALSQARAEAVKKYINKKGVSLTRMTAKGFGQTKPVADNNTADGRAKNRRVEFKIEF